MQLKTRFEQMQVGDQPAKYLDTCPLFEALGISPDVQQCSHEVWTNLFELYFDFLGLQHYYTFKMNTITREVKPAERDDSEPRKCVQKDNSQTNLMFCFLTPKRESESLKNLYFIYNYYSYNQTQQHTFLKSSKICSH